MEYDVAGNVLLAASREAPHGFCAKVCDFGLARRMDVASRVDTRTYGAPACQQGHGMLSSGDTFAPRWCRAM